MSTDTLTTPDTLADYTPSVPFSQVLEWLRESPTGRAHRAVLNARASRPATGPITLEQDMANGQLSTCCYSHGIALVFTGPADFIERFYAWAVNCAVIGTNAPLNYHTPGHVGSVAYVCPESTRHILRGLAYQFRWEIIQAREVPPLSDRVIDEELGTREIVWDDRRINALAVARARGFMRTHIRRDPSVLLREKNVPEVYRLAGNGRAEQRWDNAA